MSKNTRLNYFALFKQFLFIFFFVSLLFVPCIQIKGVFINLSEFIVPIIFGTWLLERRVLSKKYLLFLIIFIFYIFFTIIINFSNQGFSDYFELYKFSKYIVLFLFFGQLFEENPTILHKTLCISLPLLLFINLLHYFNIFNFNEVIEPYYAISPDHLKYFGYDSLGHPGTKRMIGTAANPNINGVLFLFFLTYFLTKLNNKKTKSSAWLLMLSIVGFILCQSRTTTVASIVILIAFLLLKNPTLKSKLVIICISALGVLLAILLSNLSLAYFTNTHFIPQENSSLVGRFEIWQYLYEMIKQKPIFGYGPYKQFFYENNLYSESEYVLYLWRYGIIGLILYITWILLPLWKNIKYALENKFYLFMVIAILISATTNNPLTNQIILPLFAIATAQFYSEKNLKAKKVDEVYI